MSRVPATFKVEFDAKRFKFALAIYPSYLEIWDKPPLHLLESAVKTQMEERFPNRLHHVSFYLERVTSVWNALPRFPDQKMVQVIIAETWPELPGFQVEIDLDHAEQVRITLPDEPKILMSWHPAWLEASAHYKLRNAGVEGTLNPAQLRIAYSRATHFLEPVQNYPISLAARSHPLKAGKDFHIIAHSQRLELEVVIGSIRSLNEELGQKLLFDAMDEALWKLVHAEGRSPFFKDFRRIIKKSLEVALQQPQALGLESPLVLPGAYFVRERRQQPELADLRTIAAYHKTTDHYHQDDIKDRAAHLKSHGILANATLFPVSSLPMLSEESMQQFLAFAKYGRWNFLSSARELQAMVFTIPGRAAERYSKAMEEFWQDFLRTYGSDEGPVITVISHFFPMSVNPSERKPQTASRNRQDHDGASWLPAVIREIIALPSVPADPASIASCLVPNVSAEAVKKCLDSLLASGLISYDAAYRRYHQRERNVVTGDEKAKDKILRIHEEMSELAAAVLEDPPEQMRSLALHLRIAPEAFETARQRIRTWLHGLLDRTSKERDQDQLYQISIQMFQGPN